MRETDLYPPVKAFLQSQGYEVKGEVGPADVVARRGDEPPVIVELKLRASLALFQQAADRQRLSDAVYIAFAWRSGAAFRKALSGHKTLCRRLCLGLLTVRVETGLVQAHLDPLPYRPRLDTRRQTRLLAEFDTRRGDPAQGGAVSGARVTAYRQDALCIVAHLAAHGPSKGAAVAAATGVARATRMMADNHHGWFERVSPGIYRLSQPGEAASRNG